MLFQGVFCGFYPNFRKKKISFLLYESDDFALGHSVSLLTQHCYQKAIHSGHHVFNTIVGLDMANLIRNLNKCITMLSDEK